MSDFRKLTLDVYIGDYQVADGSSAEVIENLKSGMCPICAEHYSVPEFIIPKEGLTEWQCQECGIVITVETWKTHD